jgi:hypothetical protein
MAGTVQAGRNTIANGVSLESLVRRQDEREIGLHLFLIDFGG